MNAEAEPRRRYQGREDEFRPRFDRTICPPLDRAEHPPKNISHEMQK